MIDMAQTGETRTSRKTEKCEITDRAGDYQHFRAFSVISTFRVSKPTLKPKTVPTLPCTTKKRVC
jgi:hypothetical protein